MRPDAKFLYGFQQEEKKMTAKKAVINGPRPSPLMINKDSHLIRKPSSSNHHQIRKPIIIYTQSPKIIHTKAQDFMALVQRLTGKSPSSNNKQQNNNEASDNFGSSLSDGSNNSGSIKQQVHHQWKKSEVVDETSSALRRDDDIIHEDHDGDDDKKRGASNIHQYSPNSSLLNFADMPLFTPNSSSDIFCSSTRSLLFKHSDSSPYGILGNLISPSGLEFIKELPEY